MAAINLRNYSVYALTQDPRASTFRNLSVYVLTSQIKRPNFSVEGKLSVLREVNKLTDRGFTLDQVVLDDLKAEQGAYNSSFRLTALPRSRFSGGMRFIYGRYALTEAFVDQDLSLPPIDKETTVHELIPELNARFNLALGPEDLLDAPVSSSATNLTLTAATTSFWFVPGTQVVLTD